MAIEASVMTTAAPLQPHLPDAAQAPEPEPMHAREPEPDTATQASSDADAERGAEQRRVAEARLAAARAAERAAKNKAEREYDERKRIQQLKASREKEERTKQLRYQREQAEMQARLQREQAEMQARLQRESELSAQLAAEQRVTAARAGAAAQQYIREIAARIEGAWRRPPGATQGTQCEVRVKQVKGGTVTGVQVTRCNRDDTVRQSIEDAVFRASPLPNPADPALFDHDLTITFKPEH